MLSDPATRALVISLGYTPGSFRDLAGGTAQ